MKLLKWCKFIFYGYWRIPRGGYCSTFIKKVNNPDGSFYLRMKPCPYWEKRKEYHYQEDGYCHWLESGDCDKNNDSTIILQQIDRKTGEKIGETSAPELPFGIGLLWDGVKECGIKDDEWEEIWEYDIKYILKTFFGEKNE